MKLTSPAFENNGTIPDEYGCKGEDINPELNIEEIPDDTKSLALIMDDPDAPGQTWVHWIVWNIPADTKKIEKDADISYPRGKNDFKKLEYGGPCPPSGSHRYFFKLYALDKTLNLEEGASKRDLLDAMKDHVIEKTELMGNYSK